MNIKKYFKQSAVQASIIFMVSAFISRLLGLARDILFSAYFGTTHAADALNATLPITFVVQNIVASAIALSFIPLFIDALNRSREKTVRDFNVVFSYFLVGLFFSLLLLGVFSFQIVHVLTPGFTEYSLISLTARLVDFFAIISFFWAITNFLYAVSHAHKNFLVTALVPLILNVSIIAGLLFWHNSLGVFSYTTGMLIGSIIQAFVMLFYTRHALSIKFSWNFNPKGTVLGMLIILSIPLIIQQFSGYVVTVVSNNIASHLREGSIASLGYANKLRQFAIGILTVPLATSYYPFLSEAATKKNMKELGNIFSKSIRFASFFIVPIMFIFIVFDKTIVTIVFQRGVFGMEAVALTARPFQFYSLGIFAAMITVVSMRVFFAMKDMWTPTIISLVVAVFDIVVMGMLVKIYAHAGIALAVSIGLYLYMFLLLFFLRKKVGFLGSKKIIVSISKFLAGSVIGIIIMYYSFRRIESFLPAINWYVAMNFFASFSLFSLAYLTVLYLLKADEMTSAYFVMKKLKNKLKGK